MRHGTGLVRNTRNEDRVARVIKIGMETRVAGLGVGIIAFDDGLQEVQVFSTLGKRVLLADDLF